MAAVCTLKPNVTRDEAMATLFPKGILGLLRRVGMGPLRSVADVYVPFRLYWVEIASRGSREPHWFAVDAVDGSLDLYEFERLPDASETIHVETRNRLAPALEEAQTRRIMLDKVRRQVYQRGFFRIRDLSLRAEFVPLDLHIPYWLGLYGAGEAVRLRVLDAVRHRVEGAKARTFFESWLAG